MCKGNGDQLYALPAEGHCPVRPPKGTPPFTCPLPPPAQIAMAWLLCNDLFSCSLNLLVLQDQNSFLNVL